MRHQLFDRSIDRHCRFGELDWANFGFLGRAGLQRCGKSCRLRWINYLRPDLKRGSFSQQEEDLIVALHEILGNRSVSCLGFCIAVSELACFLAMAAAMEVGRRDKGFEGE
jgi:hypothetical protein